MVEKIKKIRGLATGAKPDFWYGALAITAILIGLVVGGAIFWFDTENILFLVAGSVLGGFMGLIGVGMGVKEPPTSMIGYLGYTLIFLWLSLIFALIFFKRYAIAAGAFFGPMLLLLIITFVSSTIKRMRDKPKLDAYFEKIKSLYREDGTAHKNAHEQARKLTLTLLSDLGQRGKGQVVRFLYTEKLITINDTPIDLSGANLSGLHMWHGKLTQICLDGADVSKANLQGAELAKASMRDCDLSNATLSFADLSEAELSGATLSRADVSNANLRFAHLAKAILSQANLSQADLYAVNLSGATCSECIFSHADLSGTDIRGTDFSGAILNRTRLRDALLDNTTRIDEKWHLAWDIQSNSKSGRDLRNMDLSNAYLKDSNLSSSDLRGADLRSADLREADLRHSDLTGAQLKRALLDGAYVYGAKISEEQLMTTFSPSGAYSRVNRETQK